MVASVGPLRKFGAAAEPAGRLKHLMLQPSMNDGDR